MKNNHKIIIIITAILLILTVTAGSVGVYLSDGYNSDNEAIAAFLPEHSSWKEEPDNTIVFEPEKPVAGFIFYPGGKVEHSAYIPLMQALSERGVLCILLKMPFDLAVFRMNAADGIRTEYPHIENWYIGGHSLGGAMAASYISGHTEDFKGLVLLGAYSTEDISGSGLEVLSVFGSEDKVMDMESYNGYKANLPESFTEVIIDGGCHAYFGMYGAQEGDGTPGITNEEQIRVTAEHIFSLIE